MVIPEEQLKKQHEWERLMITRGVERYRNEVAKAIQYGAEDGTKEISRLIANALQPMVAAIDELKESIKGAGRKHRALQFIKKLPSDEIAVITSKVIMSGISTKRSYLSVSSSIGSALVDQVTYHGFIQVNSAYAKNAQKKITSTNPDQRRVRMVGHAKRAGVMPEELPNQDKVAIGSYLIKLFADTTGLVKLVDLPKQATIIDVTTKAQDWIFRARQRNELLSPIFMPTIIPPRDWVSHIEGGYYTRQLRLVRKAPKGYFEDPLNVPSEEVLSAINHCQRTGYRINPKVLEVVAMLWESGSTLAGIPSRDLVQIPSFPCPNEEVDEWKKAFPDEFQMIKCKRREAHLQEARRVSHVIAMGQALESAIELSEHEQFYFVHTMDWRGRIYPVASSLSPQGDSLSKGLLEFSEGKALGDRGVYWLKIMLANTYGYDKVSYEDRIKWAEEHSSTISMCALDPMTFKMWVEADSPWEFLACCLEWERYQREGKDMISYLPMRVDGSCNGLQHLSAALRDPVGCIATNLGVGSKPNDIYGQVASIVSTKVSKDAPTNPNAAVWLGKVDRSVVKRNVMTVSYGATRIGMLEQLREDLGKAHNGKVRQWLGLADDAPVYDYFAYLSTEIQEAITQVVKAAPTVMKWVQDVAVKAAEINLPLRWVTPSGFVVLHAYRKTREQWVNAVIGEYRIQHRLQVEDITMNSAKTKLAVSPNWIHSQDAAHCHLTVAQCAKQGITSFAMVHDSYGTHGCDMDVLSTTLREVFVGMYQGNQMQHLLAQVKQQVPKELAAEMPEPPPQGSFDLQAVKNSRYFFA